MRFSWRKKTPTIALSSLPPGMSLMPPPIFEQFLNVFIVEGVVDVPPVASRPNNPTIPKHA